MIDFLNISTQSPYIKFQEKYNYAVSQNQSNIEAISISSFSSELKEVDSRMVNLKFIENKKFIFFSNYSSPKASQFISHNQIAALIYWESANIQIRMKAKIKKTSDIFNKQYFRKRSQKKNALAISSNQSQLVDSFETVRKNYINSLEFDDLKKCPEFWGGYSFTPYYFEFWEGHKSRLNRREVYEKSDDSWKHYFLQP
ncbi:MAG: pyridoxamine 5'-phosphate oxidase [Rhodobiaceae bacterium]|nr:pyridoxamine 5'-phosphate oxidase [Rhodobiaceae bacterium]